MIDQLVAWCRYSLLMVVVAAGAADRSGNLPPSSLLRMRRRAIVSLLPADHHARSDIVRRGLTASRPTETRAVINPRLRAYGLSRSDHK